MSWKCSIKYAFLITTVILCCTTVHTARILLITTPMYSHCKCFGDTGKSLSSIGHTVFAYIPHEWESGDCFSERHVNILKYGKDADVVNDFGKMDSRGVLEKLLSLSNKLCSAILGDESGLKQLVALKMDFVIVDTFIASRCYLLIPYKLRLPYVSLCAANVWFENGKPFVPQMEIPILSRPGEMTLMKRLENSLIMLSNSLVMPWYLRGKSEIMFAPELSTFEYISLIRKAVLFIQDDDVIMSGALPVMPNTINTGGFSPRPAGPLPQEIDKFLSSAMDGAIVVSFGSFVHIPDNVIRAMKDVFGSLPLHILIKSKQDFHLRNVMTRSWIPQNDILGHNNTKLFISHCGRNGVYEAIYHGVPVMCMAMFGDQSLVAFNLERLRMGTSVDVNSLNADGLRTALASILNNSSFMINAKRISSLYRRIHAKSAGDIAAHAVDLVIKYGGDHLRSEAMDLSVFSFLLLDIWLLLLGVIVSVSVTSYLFLRWVYRFIASRKVKRE